MFRLQLIGIKCSGSIHNLWNLLNGQIEAKRARNGRGGRGGGMWGQTQGGRPEWKVNNEAHVGADVEAGEMFYMCSHTAAAAAVWVAFEHYTHRTNSSVNFN